MKYGRIPLRRYAEPADIAGPAFFLCSDDARYVTGQILMVDGRRVGDVLKRSVPLCGITNSRRAQMICFVP